MEGGKIIDISTLLGEIEGFDSSLKEVLLKIFDFVYNELGWESDNLPKNRAPLYSKIEEFLK